MNNARVYNAHYHEALVVRTRLAPPRPYKHTLIRPRLTERLLQAIDYRLTVVQARTGYGKTTALTALINQPHPVVWYHLNAEDADPLILLLHLVHGFVERLDSLSEAPLALLERWERVESIPPWSRVVDALVNELASNVDQPVFLILDDVHQIGDAAESLRILDRFIGRAPSNVHPILATRHPIQLPNLINWRVRGEVLEIGQEELAFTSREITSLFHEQYGLSLRPEQIDELSDRIEGWAIVLTLVWQRLQRHPVTTLSQALGQISGSSGDLFNYLAKEVLAQQPEDIRAFLQSTAILRDLTPTICDCLRSADDSNQMLKYLLANELFVVDLGGGHIRYHHLFRDLLNHQIPEKDAQAIHLRAADCYIRHGLGEEAIHHLLLAGAYDRAAAVLDDLGQVMVRAGRLETLAGWIESLPPSVLQNYPSLLTYLGDIARLHSRFDEALGWYQQAEARCRARSDMPGLGQALRGQARVYLDTVNPSKAELLLQEALRLSDGQEDRESRARLLELLAENLLNRGRSDEAERYQEQARELREEGPAEAELSMRLLLRTGRLAQARRLLEERAEAEKQEPILRPRAHRETLLLLSLILAFQGEQELAARYAREGTERGQALQSQFITAVGHMRQGHAWLLLKDETGYEEACRSFQKAIELSETLEVPRLKVEANWGLCQAYGFRGDLTNARQAAGEGIEIARAAGDEWVEACIRLTMGAACILAGQYKEAATWLTQAGTAFRECSDTHGEAVVRLWQCLLWQQTGDQPRLGRDLADLIELVRVHDYDFLFRRKTLLGPPDPRALVPLLLLARDQGTSSTQAISILIQLGLAGLERHPGYQLRLQTLGPFRAWRGLQEISAGEWRRKNARQLFLILLTNRGTMLDRDQIVEILWPGQEPDIAQRDFKIALSTLYTVLEPNRPRNAPSAYVNRDDTRYGLRPEADIGLDIVEFEKAIAEGDALFARDAALAAPHYRRALDLYQGEYLKEYAYADWCSEERERLLGLYLRTAERLAGILVDLEAWQETIAVCQLILNRDNCWEQAYRLMMRAYHGLGNRSQVMRTFRLCVERLQLNLGVRPSAATIQLFEHLQSQEAGG